MDQDWYKDTRVYIILFIIVIIVVFSGVLSKKELFSSFIDKGTSDSYARLQMELEASRRLARQSQLSFEKAQHDIRKITPTTRDYSVIIKPFSTQLQLASSNIIKEKNMTDILDTTKSTILNSFEKIGQVSNGKESYPLYSSILLDSAIKAYSYYIINAENTKVPLEIKKPLENNDIIHIPKDGLYKVTLQ